MISVTDLKNYVFCPYSLYIRKVLNIGERVTEYMLYGREVEKERIVAFLFRALNGEKLLKNLHMVSRSLGLSGTVEYVIVDKYGYYIPIDIKWTEATRPRRDHVVQVCAYALLIEETGLGKVKQCCLYYVSRNEGHLFRITYSYSMRRLVLKILEEVKNMLKTAVPPRHVPDRRQCSSCPLALQCPYRSY